MLRSGRITQNRVQSPSGNAELFLSNVITAFFECSLCRLARLSEDYTALCHVSNCLSTRLCSSACFLAPSTKLFLGLHCNAYFGTHFSLWMLTVFCSYNNFLCEVLFRIIVNLYFLLHIKFIISFHIFSSRTILLSNITSYLIIL